MITLEQVDQLRKRTNCSYEEAKALLEKHNGDVLEAIVDFEKSKNTKNNSYNNTCCNNTEWKKQGGDFWKNFKEVIQLGFENRVIIEDKTNVLMNISVNVMLLLIIFIPYITLPVILLLLILGYKLYIKRVKGEAVNISAMVQNVADKFSGKPQAPQPPQAQPQQQYPVPAETKSDDYNEMTIE